jgi:hypothetical protein
MKLEPRPHKKNPEPVLAASDEEEAQEMLWESPLYLAIEADPLFPDLFHGSCYQLPVRIR